MNKKVCKFLGRIYSHRYAQNYALGITQVNGFFAYFCIIFLIMNLWANYGKIQIFFLVKSRTDPGSSNRAT